MWVCIWPIFVNMAHLNVYFVFIDDFRLSSNIISKKKRRRKVYSFIFGSSHWTYEYGIGHKHFFFSFLNYTIQTQFYFFQWLWWSLFYRHFFLFLLYIEKKVYVQFWGLKSINFHSPYQLRWNIRREINSLKSRLIYGYAWNPTLSPLLLLLESNSLIWNILKFNFFSVQCCIEIEELERIGEWSWIRA